MAINTPRRKEQFDPDREFVATAFRKVGGRDLRPGQPFNKTLVSTRRLRQMYDSGYIKMAPPTADPEVVPGRPNFHALPEGAIRDWLRSHGVAVRHGTPADKVAERASQEWERRFRPLLERVDATEQEMPEDWQTLRRIVKQRTGAYPKSKAHALEILGSGDAAN
jgi:hypothetical protein